MVEMMVMGVPFRIDAAGDGQGGLIGVGDDDETAEPHQMGGIRCPGGAPHLAEPIGLQPDL